MCAEAKQAIVREAAKENQHAADSIDFLCIKLLKY
jgi:hypothetical protein